MVLDVSYFFRARRADITFGHGARHGRFTYPHHTARCTQRAGGSRDLAGGRGLLRPVDGHQVPRQLLRGAVQRDRLGRHVLTAEGAWSPPGNHTRCWDESLRSFVSAANLWDTKAWKPGEGCRCLGLGLVFIFLDKLSLCFPR